MMDLSFLVPIGFAKVTEAGVAEIPFLDRMFIVFWFVVAGMVLISKLAEAKRDGTIARHLHVDTSMFRVDGAFTLGSAVIAVALAAIYGSLW
jgi:SSS family solute:Na+ symporter